MSETTTPQPILNQDIPTPKQFKAKFKEIFDAETTFGSPRAARLELLESVSDIIQEYLKHDCSIVYLHGKLKEAGYSGSRKELSEWLIEKGLWTKREIAKKEEAKAADSEKIAAKNENSQEKTCDEKVTQNEEKLNPETDQNSLSGESKSPDPSVSSSSSPTQNARPQVNIPPGQSKSPLPASGSHTNTKIPGDNAMNSHTTSSQAKN